MLTNHYRGINEGRQAAREVDTFLMGIGSQLPVTGGIVRRSAADSVPQIVQAVTA
jgi:glutamate synthase (NADPH/NADH)